MLWKGVKKQDSGYNSHVLLKEKHTRLAYVHKENFIFNKEKLYLLLRRMEQQLNTPL